MVPADAARGLGACENGVRGSVRRRPPAPRGSWGRASAPAAPASPCRRYRRTSCGRDRHDDLASSRSRCRSRHRRPHRAGRRRADRRRSARAPLGRRCSGSLCHVLLGGAAARRRARPLCPVRTNVREWFVRGRPPGTTRCRTNPIRSRHLGRGLLGRARHDCVCGTSTSPWARRHPLSRFRRIGRRRCRRSADPAPWACASAPCPFRVLSPFAAASQVAAPSQVPARALGRALPVHPRGRSAVGRSGGVRSLPAPAAQRPRSLDPSLLPSLGARGRSGYSTAGCGCAVSCDERSVTRAAASAVCRAEDLLVQPFVPVRAAPPAWRSSLSDRPRRRAPPQLASSPISGGASRLPARVGHVCVTRITVPGVSEGSRGPDHRDRAGGCTYRRPPIQEACSL